ncbi:MAG: hypothetical protein CSA36_02915 [Draconibacterium sp.]|nr:MAG: hypothetical protein CSA36_02915 [Draconibacterium sp.]
MKITKPFTGIIAFFIVLFTMPLAHALMIFMEYVFGHEYVFHAAIALGIAGIILLFWGMLSKRETIATMLGLFSSILVWTGWVEFAFVYYANRFNVTAIMENGEVVTKPEYLIMPSSIGLWAIFMVYYFFGTKTGCTFFNWFQKRIRITHPKTLKPAIRNAAMTTFMELNMLLWTFYLVLLFVYDSAFIGDHSVGAHIVAYGMLLWSLYLFIKLLKKPKMAYAIRYAAPVVIIFWSFVEIMGRWGIFKEIWVEPMKYSLEMILFVVVIAILVLAVIIEDKRRKRKMQ